ncbi:MAG: dimethylmenaquinone methyltransferase [Candidatus Lumbricidophila eiseniae]|uniref:Putative 4-hydroxy-4-methyl-2-oxoglutarate aldolase n=1 Tax=Candidatus Lumbricidiphila eiseniae TaxID=1969409 RepID=A0A2A6FTD9_9MICO|nr:MAG: dimethylmenaquinone methyltransferase [Candidatus Lumbricidophila eiseniae]
MRIQPFRDELVELTSQWQGDRFEDGRPKVPDSVLEDLQEATTEQVWAVLWDAGFLHQYEGNWLETNPGKPIVGRAVTSQFVPKRPDLDEVVLTAAAREGLVFGPDTQNWLVVESLVSHDVMVVDLFGKIYEGTFIGDNLATAVATRTGVGAVIHGGIRDMMGIRELKAINVFYRGVDPTPIRHVTLAGLNIPVRLGAATVLPGDVVFGTPSGVIFIPPHLAERAASLSRETRLRDKFGKQRLAERTYTSADIDVPEWRSDIQADYNSWLADGTQ